jgi:methanogenesis imperfect marker protein 11
MLSRKEILEKVKEKPWVSPFEKIIGVFDESENLVQVYEYHARNVCYGAAAWAVYHYKQTSPLMLAARRDGARDIFTLRVGTSSLNLRPSFSSAGIEAVKLIDDKIHITYAGLAGGGVGSSLCRGLAGNVHGVEIHAEGGGDKLGKATLVIPKMMKLHVGVDDTDKPGVGATWSLANEIGCELDKEDGIEYLNHTLVQLYPGTPTKTTNCVATVLTFAVAINKMEYIQNKLKDQFKKLTLSEHTGLAFWSGISIPKALVQFSDQAREKVVTISEAQNVAQQVNITLLPVTGDRGLIGATAALGYSENQDSAVKPAVAMERDKQSK